MTTQNNGNSIMVQGRIVWTSGNLFQGAHQKDDRTKQPLFNQDGSPKIVYGFGLAIPKIDPRTGQFTPEYVKIYQTMQAEALTLYPGGHIPQGFSMKYKDGDTDIDQSGTPYSKREGYAGHIVVACTTQLPIKYFRFEGGNNILVNDGIKCGDYVNVQLNIKAHPAIGQGKPGLYVNPSAVQLIQPGKEIINTPSGDQLFGTAAPTYAGTVEAPTAPPMPNMGAPAMPGTPAMPPMGAPAAPTYPAQPAPAVAQPAPAPHYGVLPPGHQPAPAQPAPAAPTYPAQPGYPGMPAMPGMPR
jgi:hypothetical protein